MTSVWYVGTATIRVIDGDGWVEVGVYDSDATFRWAPDNGWSYPESAFSTQQLAWLESAPEEFWVGAPDGPRTVAVLPPETYFTLNQLRDYLAGYQFPADSGLTKASVGLPHVDDTADADKPLSTLQIAALTRKADYPNGGTDGQVLAKSGTTTAWVAPAAGGGSVAVTEATDAYWDSGTVYTVTGSGVAPVADGYWDSGTTYTIN